MRTGLFCTYENPRRDFRAAYVDQLRLVQRAESLGFEEAWVAEHHFNPDACSPSCLSILAYLAACTSRIRLGSAAVLLPFHNPLLIAEDIATIDILSDGRLNFGIAKGGPFPAQNRHFEIDSKESRDKTSEALLLIEKLLYEDDVTFNGRFFKADGVRLTPRAVQRPIPTFVASSTASLVGLAAAKGYGIMGAPPFPLTTLRETVEIFRQADPAADPDLVLIRFFHVAVTHEQAVAEARIWLQPFVERMKTTTAKVQPDWTPWFVLDRIVEESLIGTISSIGEKIERLAEDLPLHSLVLKQMSPDFAKRHADLELFAEELRPKFREAA